MILKKAATTYRSLPTEHQRWIDIDDVIVDGYVAALKIDKTFDPNFKQEGKGVAKYSTYMFKGLDFHLDRAYTKPFHMRKRLAKAIVELDAPSENGSEPATQIPVHDSNISLEQRDSVEVLLMLTRRMNQEAAAFLVGGLLCGKWNNTGHRSKNAVQYLAEIRETVQRYNVTIADLIPLLYDEKMRKKALTVISEAGSLGLENQQAARLLECVDCQAQMPLSSIASHRYDVESMTCVTCLGKLANSPKTVSCFGKSYDPAAIECKLHCNDRKICRLYQERKNMPPKDDVEVIDQDEELDNVDEDEEEEDAVTEEEEEEEEEEEKKPKTSKKSTKKTAKTKKVAKPAKSGKAKKAPKETPPKEIGPKWPFKEGSVMLWCFKKAFDGIKTSELEAQLKKTRNDVKFSTMLGALRRDEKWRQRNPTHTWKLSEEGGRLKIHDVKYVGENKPKGEKAETKSAAAPAKKVAKKKTK